jgi:hypothetical protein
MDLDAPWQGSQAAAARKVVEAEHVAGLTPVSSRVETALALTSGRSFGREQNPASRLKRE